MKKQFVVLGMGSFGASVAVTLQKLGCDVVAVDQDMERINDIADKVTYAMQADIEDPDLLSSLGSRNFDGIVVASSENLECSILATLAAKEMVSLIYSVRQIMRDMPGCFGRSAQTPLSFRKKRWDAKLRRI